jgi:2-C-methyl-D-erythritol 2,4-cyclodiphosphate synthase
VVFDGEPGLVGHSDADAVAHAVTDALLGATGLGDLGELFPDTDERWRGANSMQLLAHVVGLVASDGWRSATSTAAWCARSRSWRHVGGRWRSGSPVVGAPGHRAGRRAEGLGAIGRREGIACWAVAVVVRRRSPSAVLSEYAGHGCGDRRHRGSTA